MFNLSEGNNMVLARNVFALDEIEHECIRQGASYIKRRTPAIVQKHYIAAKAFERCKQDNHKPLTKTEAALLKEYLGPQSPFKVNGDSLHMPTKDVLWHDAFKGIPPNKLVYYLRLLRNGGSLGKPPTVTLDTIHSSKGAEADRVLILSDIAAASEWELSQNYASEHRVFYVGVTRARDHLALCAPTTFRNVHALLHSYL
jgi:hypothetical protein